MLFIDLMEIVLFVCMVLFIYKQILQPYLKGTQMFPMFHNENKLHGELRKVNQSVEEKSLKEKIKKIKKEKGV